MPRFPPPPSIPETLDGVRDAALILMTFMQDADEAPTAGMMTTYTQIHALAPKALQHWQEFQQQQLPKFNEQLKQANLPPLDLNAKGKTADVEMHVNEE